MARLERICPTMGLTPIPACDLIDIGDIHDVSSFEQYFAPTQWLYAKGSDQIHERCVKKRTDFPLEAVLLPHVRKEIPQVQYQVTYMTFPSPTWESKAKRSTRKGGSFANVETCVVIPYTGDPHVGGIPNNWKVLMSELTPPGHIPYKVRMNLVTEMSRP